MIVSSESIKGYVSKLKSDEKSVKTIMKYSEDIRHFAEYTKGRELTKETVTSYKTYLGTTCSVTSANGKLSAINGYLKYLGYGECCVKQFKTQKQTYRKETEELTREEYRKLVAESETLGKKRLSLIIQTICGTGIRVSELEYITVEAVKKGEAEVRSKNKTRKVHIVKVLRKKLSAYIKEYGIETGSVFVTKKGKSLEIC